MLDPVAVERAEKSLDEFINSRSKEKGKANAEADLWRISERIHLEKLRRENAAAWCSYHLRACVNRRVAYVSRNVEKAVESL